MAESGLAATLRALACAATLLVAPTPPQHPADEAYAELEYLPASGRLEVAVRLDSLTFDRALSAYTGREVALDDPKGEVAAAAYLGEGLRLEFRRAAKGEAPWIACTQTYLGSEFEGPDAWIYLEIALPGEPAELRASFEVLFDLFATQRNLMRVSAPRGERLHGFQWTTGFQDVSYILLPPPPA